MPTELKLQDPGSFRALVSNNALCDPAVGPDLPGATVAADQSFGGGVLSVNVHGDLSLRAFNSPDDMDDDGILGEMGKPVPVDGLPPQIELTPGTACLKYRAAAGIKAAATGTTLGALGFEIEAGADLVLADYHRHACSELTRDAVLDDIKKLRTSLRIDDVLGLTPGEAVSQQVVGRLSAAVEVSWSDVFMGPIGPLSRLAGPGASVLFRVSAGASLKASVSLSDDFLLVFSRVDEKRWRVGLRKARTREAALGLDLGVSVEFADPDQVEAILGAALEGVIGQPASTVDKILGKATLEALSPAQRKVADFLIDRFGFDQVTATIEMIRTKVDEIRNKIKETLEQVARAKVALGFVYEYRRIRQDTTVAQCTVTRAALRRHHPNLVRGRFGDLFVEAANGAGGSVLEHYLYQTTVKSERAWGFALSIGKWISLGGHERKTLLRIDRQSATRKLQRAFVGTRGYRETGQEQDRWSADFSASMPGYSRGAVPLVSEFEAGVALNWFELDKRLDDDTLSQWLDLGVLWGGIAEGETARLRDALAVGLEKTCAVVAQVAFPHEAFAIMRTRIAAAKVKEFGASLGAAMPWSREPGRHSAMLRRRLYAPLWEAYLSRPENERRRGRAFAQVARKHLAAQGFENLANMERLYAGTTQPHDGNVFCGLIDLNPHTFQNCRDFFNGVKRLNMDVLSGAPDNGAIARVFEEMENLWRQSHHVRAVGAYLVDIARRAGVLKHVSRSLAITVGPGTARAQVIVVAS
jgi:hypothetical protein